MILLGKLMVILYVYDYIKEDNGSGQDKIYAIMKVRMKNAEDITY